jgi:hypothetical protein
VTNKEIIKRIYFPLYSNLLLPLGGIQIIDNLLNLTFNSVNFKFNAVNLAFQSNVSKNTPCKFITMTKIETTIRHILFELFNKTVNVERKYSMYKLLYDNAKCLLSRFILDNIVANPLETMHALVNYYGSPQTLIFAVGNCHNDMVIQIFKDIDQQRQFIVNHYDLNICLKLSIERNNNILFPIILEYAHNQKLISDILFMPQSSTNIFSYSILRDLKNLNLNTNDWNWESEDGRPFDAQDIIFGNNNLQLSHDVKKYIDKLYLSITNWIEHNLDKFQYLNIILHYLNINNIPISSVLYIYFGQNNYLLTTLLHDNTNIFITMYVLYKYHTDPNIFINYFYGNSSIICLNELLINNDPYSNFQLNNIAFTNYLLVSKLFL